MSQFIYPYLLFHDTLEAAEFYKEVFDGEVTYKMMGSDSPNCPPEEMDKVFHLQLKFMETEIYMADYVEKNKYQIGNTIYLLLNYTDLEKMKKAYDKMKETGEVVQELGETFWGAIFGIVKDKYGYSWEFHHPVPQKK